MENQLCQIPLRRIDTKCKYRWVQGRLSCEHYRVRPRLSFLTDPESLISGSQFAGDRDERVPPVPHRLRHHHHTGPIHGTSWARGGFPRLSHGTFDRSLTHLRRDTSLATPNEVHDK